MKKMFVILFCLTAVVKAQSISGNVMLGLPQGEFKDQIDRLTYGLNVQGTLWEPTKYRPLTRIQSWVSGIRRGISIKTIK